MRKLTMSYNPLAKEEGALKRLLVEPSFDTPGNHCVSFERTLGRLEMLGSDRWREGKIKDCQICNKECYTVIAWNLELAKDKNIN